MITDRELDAQLAAAIQVRDSDLPPLPEEFLPLLRSVDEPADAAGSEPASVLAARQLVADAHQARTAGRRRPRARLHGLLPRRRTALRIGAGVAAAAVAWTVAVVVTGPDRITPPSDPDPDQVAAPSGGVTAPNGISLVAAERVTFPLSLDPVPQGLTPSFGRSGGPTPWGEGPVMWSADYRSVDGAGFGMWISPEDPREEWEVEHELPQWGYANSDITETGTVSVGGTEADLVRGNYDLPSCTYAPSNPVQTEEPAEVCTSSFADLFWERPDGQWVWLRGEDAYSGTAALVAVAKSIVDRPQPVDLQLGLAPAGWSLSGYDEGHIAFVNSDDPHQRLAVSLMERWRRETVENAFQGMSDGPEHWVRVDGRPAKMVLVDQGGLVEWFLAGELDGGVLFMIQTPASFTPEQVVELASQVTYNR